MNQPPTAMSIQVRIPEELARYCDGQSAPRIEGDTLGSILTNLVEQFPQAKPRLVGRDGQLLSHLVVLLNGSSVPRRGLAERCVSLKDDLEIMFLASGG